MTKIHNVNDNSDNNDTNLESNLNRNGATDIITINMLDADSVKNAANKYKLNRNQLNNLILQANDVLKDENTKIKNKYLLLLLVDFAFIVASIVFFALALNSKLNNLNTFNQYESFLIFITSSLTVFFTGVGCFQTKKYNENIKLNHDNLNSLNSFNKYNFTENFVNQETSNVIFLHQNLSQNHNNNNIINAIRH